MTHRISLSTVTLLAIAASKAKQRSQQNQEVEMDNAFSHCSVNEAGELVEMEEADCCCC
ncbi:hypothetical protein [Aridibaculum aurantiacum]|uniref:hypothetical protein n=1 Tax=Aridibaculum aurantiacum TaxID=2810307 RepID=UPI001A96CF6C|nr:hypothetical protein [Aridibaculum aurantiacum]